MAILAEYDPIAQAKAAPDPGAGRRIAADLPKAKAWLAKDPFLHRAWVLTTMLLSFLIALLLLAGMMWQRDQRVSHISARAQITLRVITPLAPGDRAALIAEFRQDPAVLDAQWLSDAQLRDWLAQALETKLPPISLSLPQFILITRDPEDRRFESRLTAFLAARQIAATIETPRVQIARVPAFSRLFWAGYAALILGLLLVWAVAGNMAARALCSAQVRSLSLLIELGGTVRVIAAPIVRRLGAASLLGAYLGAALAWIFMLIAARATGETPLSPVSPPALSLPAFALSGELCLVILLPVFCAIMSSLVIHQHVTSVLRRQE